jgi:hypothetical protein
VDGRSIHNCRRSGDGASVSSRAAGVIGPELYRRIERSKHHFAGCRSTGRSRATLTTRPAARPSAPRRRGATSTTRLLEDALARISHSSPLRPGPRGRPRPRAHAETTPTRGDIGPGRAPRRSRDLKTARSLRQGEDHLSGIPRFGSEPRQNRSSATKGSRGMRSRVRRAAPVRFCWKRRHDMGSLIDICSSCSSPQVSA